MRGVVNFLLSSAQWTAHNTHNRPKTIAIVGGGTAGLGALQTILDVRDRYGLNWDVVLYEQRNGLGGLW